MRVVVVPELEDNYAYLAVGPEGAGLVVDPAEAGPVLCAASREGVRLEAILCTHHHSDHTGGNLDLLRALPGLEVLGSARDASRIPGLTRALADGERFTVAGLPAETLLVPCHTSGHAAYRFGQVLFTGDTLFVAGCGKFFEGTALDMHRALHERIGSLADDTLIYPGHEYAERNLAFAARVDPENPAIARKAEEVRARRRQGLPAVPSTLGEERGYNPFLRAGAPGIQAEVARERPGVPISDPIAVLGALRAMKDAFR